MDFQKLTDKVEKHIRSYFKDHPYPELPYHNINHTAYVAKQAKKLGLNYALNEEQLFEVVAGSWFHDVGYLESESEHEVRGAKMAVEYLESLSVHPDIASAVSELILATKMPVNPQNILEEIICDADTYHLGKESFLKKNKLLKNEREMLQHKSITGKDWLKQSITFLENHGYNTEYARNLLLPGKDKNLQTLRRNYQSELLLSADPQEAGPIEIEEIKLKKNKELPEKGIESMFRIVSGNNQHLSSMADTKAHLLITVNSILLSAIISLVIRKLSDYNYLILPSCILLLVALLSIILSILSTRPTVPVGKHALHDLDLKKINILFFGNYCKMSREDFTVGMLRLMGDWNGLYEMLIMDIHAQGVVISKKYYYLRWAYNIFMFGLIAGVLAFMTAICIHNPGSDIIKP
jgi:hypothetical protein